MVEFPGITEQIVDMGLNRGQGRAAPRLEVVEKTCDRRSTANGARLITSAFTSPVATASS
jgi:hypothetical protein